MTFRSASLLLLLSAFFCAGTQAQSTKPLLVDPVASKVSLPEAGTPIVRNDPPKAELPRESSENEASATDAAAPAANQFRLERTPLVGGAELLTIERSGTSSAVRPRAARPLGRVLLSQRPVQRRELGRLREQFLGIGFEPTGTTPQGRPTSRRKTARDGRLSSRPWASRSTRDPETVRIQLPVQVCKSVTQWIRSDQRVHKRAGYRRPFGSRRDAARECSSGRSASRMS